MTRFFQYGHKNPFPLGEGFGMWSPTHITMLIALAFLIFLIVRFYKKSDERGRLRLRRCIGLLVVVMEILKDSVLLISGQFTWNDLPFALCGWGIVFVAADAFWTTKFTRECLYALTLPGAAFAILTPDWVGAPLFNYFSLHSFLIHSLLVAYSLMRIIAVEFKPSVRQLWRPALFMLVVVPPTIWLNRSIGTNFMFTETPVAGSPLAPIHTIFGNYYLLGMLLLLLIFWLLMYTPWEILAQRSLENDKISLLKKN